MTLHINRKQSCAVERDLNRYQRTLDEHDEIENKLEAYINQKLGEIKNNVMGNSCLRSFIDDNEELLLAHIEAFAKQHGL
ncbi:hypothetical protein [Sansalvadorimonas verongulae]|uniref:hypothetical protein n=1 Tax=Sansalvadorimonas verongulae TaxID=2172824 RepID=UPI0012BC939A|nr:hypothetical protein [Sansalvadorimonas verongulae]MTI11783.1 hypothetical protein [Sansalvadorimonas verongulae]